MSTLTVTITEEEQKHLRKHAARIGATEEEVLRRLIQSLPDEETVSESMNPEPDLLDEIEAIMSQVPEEELAKVPRDLTENLDHYLYGAPRK